MSACSELIYALLLSEHLGIATNGAWRMTIGFMPDSPDNAITIYDTSGKFDGRLMRNGYIIEHPGIQVRVRGLSSTETLQKATDIALKFDEQLHLSIILSSTERYTVQNISRTGPVIPMGVEEVGERRRFNYTVNAIMTVRKV